MNEIFTFLGMIDHSHNFIYASHMLLVVTLLLIISKLSTRNMQLVPRGTQNIVETYLAGVLAMGKDVIGETDARKYLPLIATIGLFVVLANVIGIIPGFESPSGSLNFTLALALTVFVYYNFEGIRRNGVKKYFGHFLGPVWWLAWLMFPIEIVSHISRVVSLSFRLFGNIRGDDLFLAVLLMLAPWVAPLPAYALLTFMAFLQAFIFMMLTYVYISGSVMMAEEDH
jgi:F-type H+-transporting ATPase subunit a